MFGIAVARLDQVTEAEKERYQSLYCGLCHTLKDRYGSVPRATLSYDLTFLCLLLGSLAESAEETGIERCASHPVSGTPFTANAFMPYAADLSVALAYYKCLDDIADEGSVPARAGRAALSSHYQHARERIPEECQAIEDSMERIRVIEGTPDAPSDAAAEEFGRLMGTLFAHDAGFWEPHLRQLGEATGRFIYLMDAAVDLADDEKSGSYNPFAGTGITAEELRVLLASLALDMARAFDVLPLERDTHLLESVIYSGIWQKFNAVYSDASKKL